jgi:hypothetical protein
VAYTYWLGIGLGCLVLLMVQFLTGGAWGMLIRRVLEAGSRTLPVLALLFAPILMGMSELYSWTDETTQDERIRHKQVYLNLTFFMVRAAIYWLCWLGLAYWLNKWSSDESAPSNEVRNRRRQILSAGGLVLYGVTITFASIDWVMSIEPEWISTIYPVMYAAGQLLTALAFAIAVLMFRASQPPLAGVLAPQHLRDLGNLLLAFVMLWAYMSFSQFLLIWSGNLPEEIPWYLKRGRDGWEWMAIGLFLFHFALPFLLLLSRRVKQDGRLLAAVAGSILLMRFLDVVWWIEPAYSHESTGGSFFWLLDIAAWLGFGGVWMWWFLGQLDKRPILPVHEASILEGTNHGSS